MLPVLGQGTAWLVTITLWSIAAGVVAFVASMFGGGAWLAIAVDAVLLTSLLALCADYHRRCLTVVISGEGSLDSGPDLEPGRVLSEYFRSGFHLTAFVLASQLLLVFWLTRQVTQIDGANPFELFLSPLFWVLAIGPACYWPMALTTASMHGDFAGVWYVPMGLRAIVRAPAEHAAIMVLGSVAFAASWLVSVIIGVASALPAPFFVATIGLPMGLSHGVMGGLSGHLVRARDDAFG
jgi:hypothetical protein